MTEGTSRSPRHPREHFLTVCIFQVLTVLRLFQECFWLETSSCRGFRLQRGWWDGTVGDEVSNTLQPCYVTEENPGGHRHLSAPRRHPLILRKVTWLKLLVLLLEGEE